MRYVRDAFVKTIIWFTYVFLSGSRVVTLCVVVFVWLVFVFEPRFPKVIFGELGEMQPMGLDG